jgi:hypothetical protein
MFRCSTHFRITRAGTCLLFQHVGQPWPEIPDSISRGTHPRKKQDRGQSPPLDDAKSPGESSQLCGLCGKYNSRWKSNLPAKGLRRVHEWSGVHECRALRQDRTRRHRRLCGIARPSLDDGEPIPDERWLRQSIPAASTVFVIPHGVRHSVSHLISFDSGLGLADQFSIC